MQVPTTLFVQQSYAATSSIDIDRAPGVATRTLYQHFGVDQHPKKPTIAEPKAPKFKEPTVETSPPTRRVHHKCAILHASHCFPHASPGISRKVKEHDFAP